MSHCVNAAWRTPRPPVLEFRLLPIWGEPRCTSLCFHLCSLLRVPLWDTFRGVKILSENQFSTQNVYPYPEWMNICFPAPLPKSAHEMFSGFILFCHFPPLSRTLLPPSLPGTHEALSHTQLFAHSDLLPRIPSSAPSLPGQFLLDASISHRPFPGHRRTTPTCTPLHFGYDFPPLS